MRNIEAHHVGKSFPGVIIYGSQVAETSQSEMHSAKDLARGETLLTTLDFDGIPFTIYGVPLANECASDIISYSEALFSALSPLALLSSLPSHDASKAIEVNIHFINAKNFIDESWSWPWKARLNYYFRFDDCKKAEITVVNSIDSVAHELVHLVYIDQVKEGGKYLEEELLAYRVGQCVKLLAPKIRRLTAPVWVEDFEDEASMLKGMEPEFGMDKASEAVDISHRARLLTTYRMYKFFGTRNIQIDQLPREKIQAFCRGEQYSPQI